jgi:hypothetical protein
MCLTEAQSSDSILELMIMNIELGVLALVLLLHHDLAAKLGLHTVLAKLPPEQQRSWWVRNLFLDPSELEECRWLIFSLEGFQIL